MSFGDFTLTNWGVNDVRAKVKMARWLLTKADSRGLTHGQKHYLIQTALYILADVQSIIGATGGDLANEVTVLAPDDVGDIPF